MSTIFASQRKDISGTGLTQTKSYNEGDAELLLDTITFDNENDYTDIITVTLDVSGLDQENFTLVSTSEVAPLVVTDPDTYTITSQYVKNNYTQNVHADVTSTIANLKLTFNNSDASETYIITVTLSDGHSSTQGTITITGNQVIDATDITQSGLVIIEDDTLWQFTTKPQIADLDESGRTYRVTLTEASANTAWMWCNSQYITSAASTFSTAIVFEGTQAEVNAALANTDGNIYVSSAVDNQAAFDITYTQEVLTGATGAPYVQENGLFSYVVTPDTDNGYTTTTGPFDWQYDLNTQLTGLATITDNRGSQYDADSVTYRAIIQLDSPAAHANGELRTFGTGGTSVWDNIDKITITGTKTQVNSHLSSIEWWSRDSISTSFTMDLTIERDINSVPDNSSGYQLVKTVNNIVMNTGTPPENNLSRTWIYNEDQATSLSDDSKAT